MNADYDGETVENKPENPVNMFLGPIPHKMMSKTAEVDPNKVRKRYYVTVRNFNIINVYKD